MFDKVGIDWPYKTKATLMAFELTQSAIQLATILAFLIAAHPGILESLGASIISLVWLRTGESKVPDQYLEMKERKQLFSKIGEWMGRDDAGEVIGTIQSEPFGGETGENQIEAAATAAATGSFVRGAISVGLYAYLLVLLAEWYSLA